MTDPPWAAQAAVWRLLPALFLVVLPLHSQTGLPETPAGDPLTVVMEIGLFNYDCVPDTLYGTRYDTLGGIAHLPGYIAWGRDDTYRANNCPPAAGITAFDGQRRTFTSIAWPNWYGFHCSIALVELNPEDTLTDLVVAMWGVDSSASPAKDTARAIVVFGQIGIDTLSSIDLSSIAAQFQGAPFAAMELRPDVELLYRQVREVSGEEDSWRLDEINFSDTLAGQQIPPAPVKNASVVAVYPNPAARAAHVDARKLAPGVYDVALIAVSGKEHRRQRITVGANGEFLSRLDLARLPNGYYLVKVQSARDLVGVYPVMIVK